MGTVIENMEKDLLAEEKAINKNDRLLKDEKIAKLASARGQMIRRATVLLSTYEHDLLVQQGKLEDLLSRRSLKTVYTMTEIGQLQRLGDLFQSFLFKVEIKNLSERGFIRLFEKKWTEGDHFSVNLMLNIAEEILGAAAYVRFTEQYKKLSAEGFSTEEKNALSSIKHYEDEIKALEDFLKKNSGDECGG
jgi:hypothetical protein